MTKNEKLIETINNIHDYIEHRFSILSDDEYNDLIYGNGIFSIVDDGINEFDKDGCLTQNDIDKLCEFCIQTGQEYFPGREYLLNIFNQMDMTIALALNSHPNEPSQVATNVGRFTWQLDGYTNLATAEVNHVNNYWQILEHLKQKFNLTDDDLSDLKGNYSDWLYEFAEDTYQQFANYCESEEQYNDRDEFIGFIGNQNILLFFEMQYIEYLFNDEKRDQYNRFK